MNIFFDMEFTGLFKSTTIISIGLISEDRRTFYAELTDYNQIQVHYNEFIRDKVIPNLSKNKEELKNFADTTCKGYMTDVRVSLLKWLSQFETIEWVSDVCHYDFVLLIDLLFGDAMKIPDNMGKSCHDINQDIAKLYNISDQEAFDKSREDILMEKDSINALSINKDLKHNSIFDAIVISMIYSIIFKKN